MDPLFPSLNALADGRAEAIGVISLMRESRCYQWGEHSPDTQRALRAQRRSTPSRQMACVFQTSAAQLVETTHQMHFSVALTS